MKATVRASIILLWITGTSLSVSAQFTQRNARDFINKTSYIIGEAYDVVYYYGYYSSGYLSNAVNQQNYAKYLYNIGNYRYAIYHSDLARSYALRVIYNSTNYWDNYYRPYYYYSQPRPPYVNNRPPQNTYYYGQNRTVVYGHRSSTSVSSVNRATNNRVSKYAGSGNDVNAVDFNTWDRNYYSSDERSLLGGTSMPSERELESAVANSANVRRVSSDKDVINSGIRDFSSDIDTYKRGNADEARSISISRPSDFGTTPEVTRSTANTVNPTTNRQSQPQAQPTQSRQTTSQPAQNQSQTQTRQATQPAQNQTQTRQTSQPAQTSTPANSTTTRSSSSSSTQSDRNASSTNQQATPQRGSTPATNQNTNSSTQRR
jgi:hypothetical protein